MFISNESCGAQSFKTRQFTMLVHLYFDVYLIQHYYHRPLIHLLNFQDAICSSFIDLYQLLVHQYFSNFIVMPLHLVEVSFVYHFYY